MSSNVAFSWTINSDHSGSNITTSGGKGTNGENLKKKTTIIKIRHLCSIFHKIITEQLSCIGSDISTDYNYAHLVSLQSEKVKMFYSESSSTINMFGFFSAILCKHFFSSNHKNRILIYYFLFQKSSCNFPEISETSKK